jgi:hypothetical protein
MGEHQREATLRPTAVQSVFDGRQCCGHVLSRGKLGFEAVDADDCSLGVFPTAEAAARAIMTRGAA